MFINFGKRKAEKPERRPSPSFVTKLIDSAMKATSSDERLVSLATLWNQIRELETEYSVDCSERSTLRDEIADAILECTDARVVITVALSLDLFASRDFGFASQSDFAELDAPLQLRLVKLHIESHLDGLERHPSEYEVQNQFAFRAVEMRKLDDAEKRIALRVEFGIDDWQSLRAMNPHVLFTAARQRRE